MPELSQETKNLIKNYKNYRQLLQPKEGVLTIHVDEIASKVASFYEKIRGVVEWREEHLLRKTAIERILKRRLLLKKSGEVIAEAFIQELIRGGHFPNDIIEETKIETVQKIIDKYLFIIENSSSFEGRTKTHIYNWITGLASCEIEETLSPPLKEKIMMEYMMELMKERARIITSRKSKIEISEEEINTQLYIAIQQAVFRLDKTIVSYHLLLKKFPDWRNLTQEKIEQITKNIHQIWDSIEKDLNHRLSGKFYNACEKYDTPYLILGDIINNNPDNAFQILEDPEALESEIKEVYQERLGKLKLKMKKAGIFSVVSIFITKLLVAIAIEIPFDKYFSGGFDYFGLGINIVIPPLLMLFLILTIRPPQKSNFQKVTMEVMKITYQRNKKDFYEIRILPKRGVIMNIMVDFFYLLSYIVTFGIIILGLTKINFGIISQIIFIIFFCLIASAGVKIRESAKELVIEERKETILQSFVEIFSIPILRMGKWLSNQWSKYNIIVIFLNSLIDMPFQLFVEFFEHWRSFLKEKKEEIH